jgi:protein phosphatase-4 regulatory subunit 3
VFEAFRANPVGDNLVSSAIVEMCDFMHTENIKSLIEYIVTKHLLSATNTEAPVPSLEDVSSPYVSTLTVLRKAYEKNLKGGNKAQSVDAQEQPQGGSDDSHSRYFHGNSVVRTSRVVMNEKALEDQVRTGIMF